MDIKIGGNLFRLGKPFAEGGEARVYKIGDHTAAKIYKYILCTCRNREPAVAVIDTGFGFGLFSGNKAVDIQIIEIQRIKR